MDKRIVFGVVSAIILILAVIGVMVILKASYRNSVNLDEFVELKTITQEDIDFQNRVAELEKENDALNSLITNEQKDFIKTLEELNKNDSIDAETVAENLSISDCEVEIQVANDDVDEAERDETKQERETERVRNNLDDKQDELDAAIINNASSTTIKKILSDIENLEKDLKNAEEDEDDAENRLSDAKQNLDEINDNCRDKKKKAILD